MLGHSQTEHAAALLRIRHVSVCSGFVCALHVCLRRYVGRRTLKPPVFPLTHWEFFGATSLVELVGYLDVSAPGDYVIAASSEDRFVLWLQDWWLHMQEEDAPASAVLGDNSWTARVNFTAPGESKPNVFLVRCHCRKLTVNLQAIQWCCS